MTEDDEQERRIRRLVEHAETRWLALCLDDDLQDIHRVLRRHTRRFDSVDARFDAVDARFDSIDTTLQAHGGRSESIEAALRSLTQMVGQVLERLPEEPQR